MPGHPPIDPEIAAALTAPDLPTPSMHPQDIPARRAAAVIDRERLGRGGAITLTERSIDGPADNPRLAALVLSPSDAETGPAAITAGPDGASTVHADGPDGVSARQGIVYIHGGGMVVGSRFDVDDAMLDAVLAGYVVISPEYRLAPEHPYPAAIEDCYAAWCWVHAHAAEFGIDPESLAIAGTSAGGGLAAGTTLLVRDRGAPLPARQILYCPMLDDREITASSQELQGEGRWDRIANRTGWSAYLGERRGGDDVPVYAAPARATDLAGLPPTFIDVGDVETFRDEDIGYAARLSRAGVPVELHVWPGGVHGFTGLAPSAALSRVALAARAAYLQRYQIQGARSGGVTARRRTPA